MAFNENDFARLIDNKKAELGLKAEEKKEALSVFTNQVFTFKDANGVATNYDGDSSEGAIANYNNPKGFRLGGDKENTSLDAYETAKYNDKGELIPYLGSIDPTDGSKRSKKWDLHRQRYGRDNNIPAHFVTQELLNAEGEIQAQRFKDAALKGQEGDTANLETQFNGLGYFDRDLLTIRNPASGEILNEVLNTPENNASYFSNYNRGAWEGSVDVWRKAQEQSAEAAGKGFWDSAKKGVSSGIDGLQATGYGFAALIADATGNKEFADAMLQEYLSQLEEAQANGANLPPVEEIDWLGNPTQVLSKLGALIGEAMPSIALMLGTGGLGGLVSQGAKQGLKYGVKHKVKGWTKDAAAKELMKAKVKGNLAGAYLGANVMETGSIYGDVAVAGNRDAADRWGAFAGGSLAASLEIITPIKLMKKMGFTKEATKTVRETLVKHGLKDALKQVGKEGLKGGGIEGFTEALQFIIEESTQDLIKHGHMPDMSTDEFKSGLLNSFVAGLVPGAALRGGVSTVSEVAGQINGNEKVVRDELGNIVKEAQDAADSTVPEHSVESEARLAEAVSIIEGLDTGIELSEQYDNASNLDKALAYVDALNKLDNQEFSTESGDSTTNKENLTNALNGAIGAIRQVESGSAVTQESAANTLNAIELSKQNEHTDEVFDTLIEKFPKRAAKYEEMREIQKSNNMRQAGKQSKVDGKNAAPGKGKRSEVVNKHLEQSINRIESISKKLENTEIKAKHRKRLEQERNNLGLLISELGSMRGNNTSTKMATKISETIKSFDYQYEKLDMESFTEEGSSIVIDPKKAEDTYVKAKDALDNDEASDVEVAEASVEALTARTKLQASKKFYKEAINKTKNSKEIKFLKDEIKKIDKALESFVNIEKQIKGRTFPTKDREDEKSTDVLFSLEIQSEETLASIDLENASEGEKALHIAHTALSKADTAYKEVVKKSPKLMGEVHNDVIAGKDAWFRGFNTFLEHADDKFYSSKKLNDFVERLGAKVTAFHEANTLAYETGDRHYINKETLEITDDYVGDIENYWFAAGPNSDALIELLDVELSLGIETVNTINKYKKFNPAKQQSKDEAVRYDAAIEKLEALKSKLDTSSENLEAAVDRTDSGIPKEAVKKYVSQVVTYKKILGNTKDGVHTAAQLTSLDNLKSAINKTRKQYPTISKEAKALHKSQSTPKEPVVVKTTAATSEEVSTPVVTATDNMTTSSKEYLVLPESMWDTVMNNDGVLKLTTTDGDGKVTKTWVEIIDNPQAGLTKKAFKNNKEWKKYQKTQSGIIRRQKSGRKLIAKLHKEAIKADAKQSATTVDITPVGDVVDSYNTRFEKSKRKIRIKFDRTIKSLAVANPTQVLIKLNPEAIANDYEAGMVHIEGKSKGELSNTSIQKKEVFKLYNIDIKAFKKYIEENGGLETYVKFIIEHELQHFRQRALADRGEGKAYPKDLMHPDALELEHDSNLAGFKAIGFVQYTKANKEARTKLEQQLVKARDKFAAIMKEIEATVKDFKNNPAYIKAKKNFDTAVVDLKVLKQLGIEGFKAERARKLNNSILQKIKDKVFPLAESSKTTYTVTDIFKVKDINRTSFFSENTDEVLTGKSIAKKLKALGITDTAYIRAIAKNFTLFKDNFNANVLPVDVKKAYLSNNVYINNQTHNAFYVKDDSERGFHMPDEILFAMMLTTLQWTAINVNKSQIKPGFAIAKWALGDPKRVGDLSTKQYQVFRNQGIQLREAANDIGSEIMDLLNMHADTETKESLQMHMELMKYEAYASENMLLKDSTFNNKAGNSLALLALETARHMYIPKNKGKDIESGLVEIAKALYDKDLFDSGVYKGFRNVGKYKKALEDNTVLIPKVEDNVEVAEVLEIIRENVEGFELIKGAESSLKDVSSQPIKTVKDRVKNSFFDTAARANKLVQAVQNVAWQGKKPELSLVAVLDDATLENVVNIKDPSTVHITEREGIETANEEKLQDIQYVKDYLLAGKNKLKQFFLRYALQKQHRLRIDVHTLNPQRSKIIRGLIFPKDKDTTIGAKGSSNKAELDRAVFMVAVAQAFGYGVDKKVLGDVFTKFDEINSNETVQKLIKAINKKTQNKKLINKLMNEVLALEFVTPSMHVVEGVVALASYSATESFNTTLGMETDGVTNGYAISIMQFLGVDPEILKRKYESPQERKLAIADDLVPRFERIGVFIGKETDDYGTFEKFIASGKDDIYQALTRRLRITLAGTLSTQIATADALKLLHGDLVEKDLITLTKFARDLAKNPLMISNYGAGIARVIKDITSGFVPGIYKKLAEIQTDYDKAKNKTERAVVLVKLQEFEEALKAFNNVTLGDNLVEMIKSKAVDVEGNPTNLYSLEFDKDNLLKLEIKFKDLHAEPIKDALNELIGPLKESREVIIEAVENSFFAFMLKFKEATDVKPPLTSGAKELVANELAAKYMPAMTGPWARGENLIQLIKTVQESNNNKIQIVTKPIQIHTYKKESKLWGDPVDTNETTTLQISDTSYEFISPGTSVGTNMVQNLESVVLGEMLLANIDQMPIFDAKISSVGDTFESTAEYNKLFKDINLKHSFLKEALIQFDRINNNLTAEERKSVDADMKIKSFRAMSIAKRLSKETEPHKIAELDKQAKTLGTAHARARLVAKIAEVEEQHAALEKIHGTPGKRGSWITRVSQMFIHETLEKIASGEMTIEDVKNIKFTKATQSTEILFKEVSVRTFKGSKQAQEYARNNPDTSVYALRVTYGMDLPHVSNDGTLGNPWKVNKENPDFAQLEVGTAQEALEKYKLWLDGRFPEIFTPQHKWLMEQIDNGFFDGRTLVIASRGPNDVMARRRTAEVLAEFINKKSGNLTAEPIKILFKEDSNPGYAARTKINAASDATLAIAVDFNSAGEKLTKRMVNAQGNLYLDIDVKDTLSWTDADTKSVVERLNGVGAQSLNIAGNGIYTMKGKYTQEQIDEFTFKVLKAITTHPQLVTPISSVNTGGQTGFDEAGAKAGVKLGLPTTVLAPKGWKFRNIEGKDVANKDAFMRRFTVVENVVENSPETTKQTASQTDSDVLQSIDRKIKQKIENVYTKDLQENLQNVFDELGAEHSTSHVSPQQKRKHEAHLQVLMDEIFSKAGTALNETTITLNDTDIVANGWANIGSDAVTVNLNKDAPVSHSEQTAQEVYMHEIVHILTRSALTHNTVFKSNIRRIRRDVRNHLEKQARPYELFLHKDDNGKIIYLTDKDAEIAAAKKQYKYVFGSKVPAKAVLDEFLAYALTNPFLVAKLKSMPASEVDMWSKHPDDTVIEKLVKLFAIAINDFINLINKKDKPANLQMEIFNLTKELVVATQTKRGKIMQTLRKTRLNDLIDKGNQTIHDFFAEAGKQSLKVGSKKYIELVDKWTKDGRINNFVANFLYTTKLAAIPGAYGDFIADHPKLQGHLDRAFRNFKPSFRNNIASFKSDIFGTVDQNFIELLYKSQAEVDINRHQYKSATREALYNAFMDSDALTDDEKIAITKMLLKTDFSVLESTGAYTIIEAIKLLDDPKALNAEIAKYAQRLDIANNKHYDVQTSQLANFMLKGKVRNRNQYKNAQVIFNKNPLKSTYNVKDGNEINDLDVYTTLLAIKKSETHNLKLTNEVIKREFALDAENNGITNIIHLHTAFKNKSLAEGFGNNPTQMSKGFIATIVDPDVSIEFASVDVDTVLEMEKKGYTLVTPFEDITGVNDSGYGIYVITNNPELTRTKGIASVKAKRASGFSLKAILARDETNIGKINGKFKQFARAQEKGINTLDRNHTMLPVIDEWGNITDYTVHMNHHYMEEILKQDLMFDEVLPTMFSQQEDKIKSEKINDKVIKMLHKHSSLNYEKAPQKFINILDPLYKEEYFSTLPKKARWLIEQYATTDDKGNNVFFVERGLLDTVFGYVNPSVSNLALFNVLPPQYKRYAKVLGKLITEMVALAKVNIVIKIPIVPAVNITSNFITSALYGVPPTYIIKKWKEGILELRDYQTDAKKLKIMDIEMQGNPAMQNNASVKKKRDILVARMNDNKVSWFIDKGLFNSITEDINQNEYTYRHKIGDKLKRSKAGTLLNTVTKGKAFSIANQAYMGEHTAVFKSMMHFTQMSDFIARYTLYKYNTEVKGVHPDKAWKQMVETFVNYDQPLNRYVQWTNDVGLIMFVKYWVRIQRAGLNLIKEKPLNVALLWTGSTLLDVDVETILQTNIVTGNFFPTVGGISMIMGEVMIPPGLEILSGEGF